MELHEKLGWGHPVEAAKWDLIDKSYFPYGEWHKEADYVRWASPANGLVCEIHRERDGGLAGFVGVLSSHDAHGRHYSEVNFKGLDVTFGDNCHPLTGAWRERWFFGFRVDELIDYLPGVPLTGEDDYDRDQTDPSDYKNLDAVRARVERLSEWLLSPLEALASHGEVWVDPLEGFCAHCPSDKIGKVIAEDEHGKETFLCPDCGNTYHENDPIYGRSR